MRLGWRAGFVLLAAANLNGDCGGGCPTPPTAAPMTEARARQIDASVTTGLALSTTYVFGDCRPSASQGGVDTGSCEVVTRPACVRERRAMRVFVLDVNQSVPIDDACDGRYAVDVLSERAAVEVASSADLGEVVTALAPGFYSVFVTADDACAVCGIVTIENTCEIEIVAGRVTARDLVVDVSTR